MKNVAIVACIAALMSACGHGSRPATGSSARSARHEVRSAPARPVYRYSVVPGGVVSAKEVAAAVSADPVVARHYSDIRVRELRPERLDKVEFAYVSFRKNGKVYWTARKIRLGAGETVLTDGKERIRSRCGNRISEAARKPTLAKAEEPTPEALDTLTREGAIADENSVFEADRAGPALPAYSAPLMMAKADHAPAIPFFGAPKVPAAPGVIGGALLPVVFPTGTPTRTAPGTPPGDPSSPAAPPVPGSPLFPSGGSIGPIFVIYTPPAPGATTPIVTPPAVNPPATNPPVIQRPTLPSDPGKPSTPQAPPKSIIPNPPKDSPTPPVDPDPPDDPQPAPVPEPALTGLVAAALAGIVVARRSKRSSN